MSKVQPPIRYSKQEKEPAKVMFWMHVKDDEYEKVKVPLYDDGDEEAYLIMAKKFQNVVQDYDLLTKEGVAELYCKFQRCLKGDAQDTWDDLIEG